jgi:transcriptional regulator of acetoin/glycerol metabolism
MLSCVNDTRKVVHAMKLGALDYLTKPFQKAELDAVIDLSLGQGKQTYSGEVEELSDDVFFIAASPQMRKIRSQAALVANVDIPVLLLGESGTGKEVLGRLIHKLSPALIALFSKSTAPRSPLICSRARSPEQGAFTARIAKPGKFELGATGERFCSTKSDAAASASQTVACWRSAVLVWAAVPSSKSMCASWLPPTSISPKRSPTPARGHYRLNAFTMQIPPLRGAKKKSHPAQALDDA